MPPRISTTARQSLKRAFNSKLTYPKPRFRIGVHLLLAPEVTDANDHRETLIIRSPKKKKKKIQILKKKKMNKWFLQFQLPSRCSTVYRHHSFTKFSQLPSSIHILQRDKTKKSWHMFTVIDNFPNGSQNPKSGPTENGK